MNSATRSAAAAP